MLLWISSLDAMAEPSPNLHEILFLDIETVPGSPDWNVLSERVRELWKDKSAFYRERHGLELEESYDRAGIYAEFGKVVCIGVGYFHRGREGEQLRITSFHHEQEEVLLKEFADFLHRVTGNPFRLLCAHNGKEFDFPYLCRRLIIQGIGLPRMLRIAGMKPWEVPHLDTMDMWKFGDYKHFTSLTLLAEVLGVPDSKDDINGSQVGQVYWKEQDLDRIARYCEKDVLALARVYQRLTGHAAVADDQVVFA